MMLQVPVDSDAPQTWFAFDNSHLSATAHLSTECAFIPYPYSNPNPRTLEFEAGRSQFNHPAVVANNDYNQFRVRQCLKPLRSQPESVSHFDMSDTKVVDGHRQEGFVHIAPRPQRAQPHVEESEELAMPNESKYPTSTGQNGRNGEPTADDTRRGLYHPIPKPSLYLAANNFTTFADAADRGAAPGFDCTDGLKREHLPLDMGEGSFYQDSGLVNNPPVSDAMPLFPGQGSPGGTSVATIEEQYTPNSSTSGSWPAYNKLPSQWNVQPGPQPQDIRPSGLQWTSNLPTWTQAPSLGRTEFDGSITAMDNPHGPPLVSDLQSAEPMFAPSNQDPAAVSPASELFGIPAGESVDGDRTYRPNSALYGSNHSTLETEVSDPEATGLTISCNADIRNAFLIECKLRGLSYKDIKRIGGFKEAESTLRGRFRTLTKTKDQRVRKPQWKQKDLQLLCEAVNACSESCSRTAGTYNSFCRVRTTSQPPKVSWKKVAQYIWSHGGSYHFGNATCKKKWCEVHNVKQGMA